MANLGYGHLNRQTWRTESDTLHTRKTPLSEILSVNYYTGGAVYHFKDGPSIIVHNCPPNQVEVRLRWLGAKVDTNDALKWLYAPDVAGMMIDKTKLLDHYDLDEIMGFLGVWALLQDWGKTPEIREW